MDRLQVAGPLGHKLYRQLHRIDAEEQKQLFFQSCILGLKQPCMVAAVGYDANCQHWMGTCRVLEILRSDKWAALSLPGFREQHSNLQPLQPKCQSDLGDAALTRWINAATAGGSRNVATAATSSDLLCTCLNHLESALTRYSRYPFRLPLLLLESQSGSAICSSMKEDWLQNTTPACSHKESKELESDIDNIIGDLLHC